ncbi:hypothetical protein P4H94_29590 [Paenibacillus macerans]|uniref:Uncharacterized protein n=1 Tax=Paenibacillus macerans TaxID=44252 RepID=A0A6N8EYK7_PAEMA|nr:hypothetical protein [Paenibacillus macerans]MBS5912715.1 hypothetical protein [Paenibacillus macerans]MEC0140996.1 hypothetical protein [Paenibacillus macerans]MUG23883.1 hypothetical protein [Paenibacillus macerans]UMV46534.1 hypothetical protein LMZ02_24105 [Paenibacillus macerans]GBK63260.1 hypothetical protein PbDSM24746_32640 [Paenibacillus macerans]
MLDDEQLQEQRTAGYSSDEPSGAGSEQVATSSMTVGYLDDQPPAIRIAALYVLIIRT